MQPRVFRVIQWLFPSILNNYLIAKSSKNLYTIFKENSLIINFPKTKNNFGGCYGKK